MEKHLEFLCESKNGKNVMYDPESSHTATHFRDTPSLRDVTEAFLAGMVLEEDVIARDFDMGKVIGDTDVVEIDATDEIIYAMRTLREDQGYVPFTKSRSAQPSTFLSVYLAKIDPKTYELGSAWIGEYESPLFPQMAEATPESIPYWNTHAFVWGSQQIIPGSELANCPW